MNALETEVVEQSTRITPFVLGQLVPEQGGYYAGVVRGENGAPDHHLFVAPEDASADEVRWGKYGKSIEGARLVNDGAANTE
ncbi:MAG: hypothetical protein ACK50D_11420, partial [Burkholderiales bacterium]